VARPGGLFQHVHEQLFAPQAVGVVEHALPVEEALDAPLVRRDPVELLHQLAEVRVAVQGGRLEAGELRVAEVGASAVGPAVIGIHDGHAVDGGDGAGAVRAGQQVQRRVRPGRAPDAAARKPASQFGAHLHHAIAPVGRIGVEPLAEADVQMLPVPGGREADLRAQERLLAFGGPARGRRGRGDVADQLRHPVHGARPAGRGAMRPSSRPTSRIVSVPPTVIRKL